MNPERAQGVAQLALKRCEVSRRTTARPDLSPPASAP